MNLYAAIARLLSERKAFVLATVIESQGSTPQKPGSKMAVLKDGTLLGTVGGGAIEMQIIEAARALFEAPKASTVLETHLTHDLGMCCGGRMKVFLEKHDAAPALFILGAGHVSKCLAETAQRVGFAVTVVDARPDWANAERFPDARIEVLDPVDFCHALDDDADRYYCVVTHDHGIDQSCVEVLLKKPARYLGVIGSRRKAERFKMRLRAANFTDAQLERIRCPMGLPIEAISPEEIAVSIVSELIQTRRAQNGSSRTA